MITRHANAPPLTSLWNIFSPLPIKQKSSLKHVIRISTSASLIPRQPDPGEKYTSVVPSIDTSKTPDLRSVKPFGPRGIILFGFDATECTSVQSWLKQVDSELIVVSYDDASFSPDCTLRQVLSLLDPSFPQEDEINDNAKTPPQDGESSEHKLLTGNDRLVLFSGLLGEEMQGLAELWSSFTGIEQVSFASVSERILNRRLDGLVEDILKANAPRASSSAVADNSPFTMVTQGGKIQTTNKNELRQALQKTVMQKKKQKDEEDNVLTSLRSKKNKQSRSSADEKKKGFS